MFRSFLTIILLAMILCAVPIIVQAATWYVTTNGNDLAAGTSWDTALLTIAAGVTKASAPDDVVLVSNCVINGNSADWYGGGVSVLGNGLLKDCVISNNTTGARGAAVYVGNGRIEGCTIINNNTSGDYGGGVNFCSGASGSISNCSIIGNTCGASGGGMFIYSTAAVAVRNCTILDNSGVNGGGINTAAAILFENCRIGENQASSQGGGIYISNANAGTVLRNCLIDANAATLYGGGISLAKPMTLQNCTIVSNSASMNPGLGGGGIRFAAAGVGCTAVNTIVYFNTGWGATSNYVIAAGSVSFSNSCVAPGLTGASAVNSSDNITNNPMFVAQYAGDYRLELGSPCINTGTNQSWMTDSKDLDGRLRVRYGTVDMGCYEYVSQGTVFSFY